MISGKKCIQINVKTGEVDGNTKYDIYTVGHIPTQNYVRDVAYRSKVTEILPRHLNYTTAAEVYFENGSYIFVEDVKKYIKIDDTPSEETSQ